jgi:hypothetical protein
MLLVSSRVQQAAVGACLASVSKRSLQAALVRLVPLKRW